MSHATILGGAFGLEFSASPTPPPFIGARAQFFLNVRCALKALLHVKRPRCTWLPSYFCPALLAPFQDSGIDVRYYGVDEHLRVYDGGWLKDVQSGDFVIAIHYFGVAQSDFPAALVKQREAYVIEDSSQALFLPQQFPGSLCVLYSPRKFLGVPDGGIMVSNGETGTEQLALDPPPLEWWNAALAMTLERRAFDLTGLPMGWYEKFQQVESSFPLGRYRSSDLARALLTNGVDYEAVRKRRRANYQALLDAIGEGALFPEIPTVPLGFPVRVDAGIRDEVLRRLHAARIYAPMHWRIENALPESFEDSRTLALSSLTLVCDQRYTPDDMAWEAHEFRRICSQPGS